MVDTVKLDTLLESGGEVIFELKDGELTANCSGLGFISCQEKMTYEEAYTLYRWLEINIDNMSDSPVNLPSPWETVS